MFRVSACFISPFYSFMQIIETLRARYIAMKYCAAHRITASFHAVYIYIYRVAAATEMTAALYVGPVYIGIRTEYMADIAPRRN